MHERKERRTTLRRTKMATLSVRQTTVLNVNTVDYECVSYRQERQLYQSRPQVQCILGVG